MKDLDVCVWAGLDDGLGGELRAIRAAVHNRTLYCNASHTLTPHCPHDPRLSRSPLPPYSAKYIEILRDSPSCILKNPAVPTDRALHLLHSRKSSRCGLTSRRHCSLIIL